MKKESSLIIYCDGGARGNPGPAAYGFVIYDQDMKLIYEEGKNLGIQTNNYAEYMGVVSALKYVSSPDDSFHSGSRTNEIRRDIEYSVLSIQFFLDSQLVTEQLSNRWKIKNENLRNLFFTIKELERKIGAKILYSHVRREANKEADRMVNLALDGEI